MIRILLVSVFFLFSAYAQCPPADPVALAQQRQASFLALRARFSDPSPIATQVTTFTPFITPDFVIEVFATGSFGGPDHGGHEGAVEYILLINPFFNRGFYNIVVPPTATLTPMGRDVIKVVFSGGLAKNYLNETITTDYSYIITYEDCGPRMKKVVLETSNDQVTFTLGGTRSTHDICQETQANCVGANQQFTSVEQCANFLSSLPFTNCDAAFKGNNLACRYLHHLLTKSGPNVHCAHVGMASVPCADVRCPHINPPCSHGARYNHCN